MVFEAHCISFPCTELLLFNYAKVDSFPFYGTFKQAARGRQLRETKAFR